MASKAYELQAKRNYGHTSETVEASGCGSVKRQSSKEGTPCFRTHGPRKGDRLFKTVSSISVTSFMNGTEMGVS